MFNIGDKVKLKDEHCINNISTPGYNGPPVVFPKGLEGVVVDIDRTWQIWYQVRFDQGCITHCGYFSPSELVSAYVYTGVEIDPYDWGGAVADPISPSTECWNHDWKTYIGLQKKFEYCTKCDQKRNEGFIYE